MEVSQRGRNTQGVTLIRLPAEETLVSVVRLDADESNGDDIEGEVGEGIPPTSDASSDPQAAE
jgi:DNA gyrase subunit A